MTAHSSPKHGQPFVRARKAIDDGDRPGHEGTCRIYGPVVHVSCVCRDGVCMCGFQQCINRIVDVYHDEMCVWHARLSFSRETYSNNNNI